MKNAAHALRRLLGSLLLRICLFLPLCPASSFADEPEESQPEIRRIDGYKGIWFDLGQRSEFGSKYSGGLGTYTAKHHPLAVHAAEVGKTFFVYGGTTRGNQRHLLAMAAYYDHTTGMVPRPVVVHDKQGVDDPHDNPSLQIDGAGRLWVFVSGRGRVRPGHLYRSRVPHDIDSFERFGEREMTYPQPWWIQDQGFLMLFTKYTRGRALYWSSSDTSGARWSKDRRLAAMGGHYQVSNEQDGRVITAFNMHPGGQVDERTNLYFVQSDDAGKTWRTAAGKVLKTPIKDPGGVALVRDYRAAGRLVYLKDIGFDQNGNPVILYLTSSHHQPGPKGEPRTWSIAHWEGEEWRFHDITSSTHNYDTGSLYLEKDGTWRVIAPTGPGPQAHGAGGEIVVWLSRDQGRSWRAASQLTKESSANHGYVRRPRNAHPEFYAFWADGNPDGISESRLYFSNQAGSKVWTLPYEMKASLVRPGMVGEMDIEAGGR